MGASCPLSLCRLVQIIIERFLDYQDKENLISRTIMKIKRTEMLQASHPLVYQVRANNLSLEIENTSSNIIPVTLKVDQAGSDFNIKGKLSITLRETCDRCLTPFYQNMDVTFQLLLTEKESLVSGDQDNDIYLFPAKQHEFDLSPTIRDAILLERSMKQICKDECNGFCPGCGTNLNEKKCLCKKEKIDERWAPLKELSLF